MQEMYLLIQKAYFNTYYLFTEQRKVQIAFSLLDERKQHQISEDDWKYFQSYTDTTAKPYEYWKLPDYYGELMRFERKPLLDKYIQENNIQVVKIFETAYI